MAAKKVKPKFNAYTILERAVDQGAAYGYRRAYKHTDSPSEEAIIQSIVENVMNELCEVINFEATNK